MGVSAPSDAARRVEADDSAEPDALALAPSPSQTGKVPISSEIRRLVHGWVRDHMDFVWRSLLRLGVSSADCDDGCQRVWLVVANKAASIDPDRVKSFIFSVVLRVASDMRRMQKRNEPLEFDERSPPPGTSSGIVDAEAVLEQQRGWRLLDQVLSGMSWELRTVFVMYELEGMSSVEIAEAIGARRGTVASRLRLAREAFQRGLRHYQARPQAATSALPRKPWWSA